MSTRSQGAAVQPPRPGDALVARNLRRPGAARLGALAQAEGRFSTVTRSRPELESDGFVVMRFTRDQIEKQPEFVLVKRAQRLDQLRRCRRAVA